MKAVLWMIIGYLFGSINWGLLIGKVFYHKDIREYGSGNAGGTNAGRVLGKKIGYLVIFLDASKALLCMILCHLISPGVEQFAGLAVCVGHCFPIFAQFKGGKAVASSFGYFLGLMIFTTHEAFFTFISPVVYFFLIVWLKKMVSLASMISVTMGALGVFFFVDYKTGFLMLLDAALVIYRHKANIERIKNGTESKVTFDSKKKTK